jgi:hypothetical protein
MSFVNHDSTRGLVKRFQRRVGTRRREIYMMLAEVIVETPVLVRPDFNKPFILDVNWSIKGVGVILSQKFKREEQVIAYASKGLSLV